LRLIVLLKRLFKLHVKKHVFGKCIVDKCNSFSDIFVNFDTVDTFKAHFAEPEL